MIPAHGKPLHDGEVRNLVVRAVVTIWTSETTVAIGLRRLGEKMTTIEGEEPRHLIALVGTRKPFQDGVSQEEVASQNASVVVHVVSQKHSRRAVAEKRLRMRKIGRWKLMTATLEVTAANAVVVRLMMIMLQKSQCCVVERSQNASVTTAKDLIMPTSRRHQLAARSGIHMK